MKLVEVLHIRKDLFYSKPCAFLLVYTQWFSKCGARPPGELTGTAGKTDFVRCCQKGSLLLPPSGVPYFFKRGHNYQKTFRTAGVQYIVVLLNDF